MTRRYLPHETLPPYTISEHLAPQIEALDMADNLTQMQEEGYTVLHDVAPIETTERIREAIVRLAQETEGPTKGMAAGVLLGRDPVFSEAVLAPKLLALVEYMCGQGALLSMVIGTIKPQDAPRLQIHADQNFLPAPFPAHNRLLTICWACDPFTETSGATRMIPGSHRHRRHPSPEEAKAAEGAIPVLCPPGSVVAWDGSVWHGNYVRRDPGERVTLHITYSRLALRPIEDYSHLGLDFLERHPPEMAVLLGLTDFFGTGTPTSGGFDIGLFRRTTRAAKT